MAAAEDLEAGERQADRHPEDLQAWADATGQPETYGELLARLRGFESHIRSWRRQLSGGHQPVQQTIAAEYERSATVHGFESATVPGILQTADYARHVFNRYAELQHSPGTPRRPCAPG